MAWATSADVIGSWIGGDAPQDPDLVDTWIGRAERSIRARVPDLQARLDAEAGEGKTDLIDAARDVTVALVTRVFRNPEGFRSVSAGAGPMTSQHTYGGDTPGGLELTKAEVAMLTGNSGGAFSIDLMPETAMQGWGWHDFP